VIKTLLENIQDAVDLATGLKKQINPWGFSYNVQAETSCLPPGL
jgi:hypothetical protein